MKKNKTRDTVFGYIGYLLLTIVVILFFNILLEQMYRGS